MFVGVTMKKDKLIIVLFSLVLGLIFIRFGSSMDFLNQHIVFPNYLRELFYSSGKIIPGFIGFHCAEHQRTDEEEQFRDLEEHRYI